MVVLRSSLLFTWCITKGGGKILSLSLSVEAPTFHPCFSKIDEVVDKCSENVCQDVGAAKFVTVILPTIDTSLVPLRGVECVPPVQIFSFALCSDAGTPTFCFSQFFAG